MRRLIFILFSPNEQRGGGGGDAAKLCTSYFLSFSADHERDRLPCKVLFWGLATNTLNVRNNNNKQQCQQYEETRSYATD